MREIYNWDKLPVLLSVRDAALALNCREAFVRKLCHEGVIPAKKLGGKLWRIPREKLRQWVESTENTEEVN